MMRVVPVGNYDVTIDVDDTYSVVEAMLTVETWISKDEPEVEIVISYADDEPFWYKFTKQGKLHRSDGPAHVLFARDGTIVEQIFALDGVPFVPLTNDGPLPSI